MDERGEEEEGTQRDKTTEEEWNFNRCADTGEVLRTPLETELEPHAHAWR